MKKDLYGIIGVTIGIIGFSIYYYYAYIHYDSTLNAFDDSFNRLVGTLSYIPIMVGLSLILFQLALDNKGKLQFRVYGSSSVFWAAISVSFIFKDVLHLISTKLFIISTALLCTIFGLILFAYRCSHR